jgi:hypothetical protein
MLLATELEQLPLLKTKFLESPYNSKMNKDLGG